MSRPVFVTNAAIAGLAQRLDVKKISANFVELKQRFDELQAAHIALKNNVKGEVRESINDTERLLLAAAKTKQKGQSR